MVNPNRAANEPRAMSKKHHLKSNNDENKMQLKLVIKLHVKKPKHGSESPWHILCSKFRKTFEVINKNVKQ